MISKIFTRICISILLLCEYTSAISSNVVEVSPLTNKIIMIRFDDGIINHHKAGQTWENDYVSQIALQTGFASLKESYTILSIDDPNYTATGILPLQVGRKSKGKDFSGSYAFSVFAPSGNYVREHWVYLFLPNAMKRGFSYTVNTGTLAEDVNEFTFVYNEKLRSEAVHTNLIGYAPSAALKFGYIYHWLGDKGGLDLAPYSGKSFGLVNTLTGNVAYSGNIVFRNFKTNQESSQTVFSASPNSNFLGADVYEANFSSFNTPGIYVLTIEGIGSSHPFEIGTNVYKTPFYVVMKGILGQRSGISLAPPYVLHKRPAPHNPLLTPGFRNRLKYTTTRYFDKSNNTSDDSYTENGPLKAQYEDGFKGVLTTSGWYQDAGDWDAYLHHTAVPAHLLFLYETNPTKFIDGDLLMPESGNGFPDLLDEARWLIKFYYGVRHEIMDKGWGTGGVPGSRVFGDYWGADSPGGITRGSWQDNTRDWYVSGEDPFISYQYAGLAAHMAFVISINGFTDPQGIDWKKEAIDAYDWALANTKGGDTDIVPYGVKGPKSEYRLKDFKFYAETSLFRLTGDAKYHDAIKGSYFATFLNETTTRTDFGAWLYCSIYNQAVDNTVYSYLSNYIKTNANKFLLESSPNRATRWGGDFSLPLVNGQATTPIIQPGIAGYQQFKAINTSLSGNYLQYIYTTADYFLGTNPLNQTWVTGLGRKYPTGVFNLDNFALVPDGVLQGIVPYGGNAFGGGTGPTNPYWGEGSAYPLPGNVAPYGTVWPAHERWFNNRYSPFAAEYTITQNQLPSAYTFGFLYAQTKDLSIKENQQILFDVSDSVEVFKPIKMPIRASSGLALTTYSVSGPVSLSGTHFVATALGVITFTGSQDGDAVFNQTGFSYKISIVKKNIQTIKLLPILPKQINVATVNVVASSSSGFPIVLSVTGPSLVINNSLISLTGLGDVTVIASQSGDINYEKASSEVKFKVYAFTQTITSFELIPDKTFGDADVTLNAVASSGLQPAFSFSGSGFVQINGNTLSLLRAGVVSISAFQPGNIDYLESQPLTQVFTIAKKGQTIQLPQIWSFPADQSFSYPLNATASSGLAVSYAVSPGATIVGGDKIRPLDIPLIVTVTASQVGNVNYLPATNVNVSVQIYDNEERIVECVVPFPSMVSISGATFTGESLFCATVGSGFIVDYSVSGAVFIENGIYSVAGTKMVTVTGFVANSYLKALSKAVTILPNTSGIYDNTNESLFQIYPNPAENLLYIRAGKSESVLILKDVLGRVLLTTSLLSGLNTLTIEGVNNGLYIVEIGDTISKEQFKLQINR